MCNLFFCSDCYTNSTQVSTYRCCPLALSFCRDPINHHCDTKCWPHHPPLAWRLQTAHNDPHVCIRCIFTAPSHQPVSSISNDTLQSGRNHLLKSRGSICSYHAGRFGSSETQTRHASFHHKPPYRLTGMSLVPAHIRQPISQVRVSWQAGAD